jgi:hypothetical protein
MGFTFFIISRIPSVVVLKVIEHFKWRKGDQTMFQGKVSQFRYSRLRRYGDDGQVDNLVDT